MNASQEKLQFVSDIGPAIAESVFRFFHDRKNRELISRLRAAGLQFEETVKRKAGKLSGKIFVITGTLSVYKRDDAKELIESMGGKVTESVSKKTDYVVVGADPGSKYDKAQKLKIAILMEDDFTKLIEKSK